jgi:hypothetical protein
LNEQESDFRRLSAQLEQSENSSTALSESLRNLRLQYETRIADLESQLRRSRVVTWATSAGTALAGFGLGRLR